MFFKVYCDILLFHTFGGQYRIDRSVRIYANPLSPFAEAVVFSFQIVAEIHNKMETLLGLEGCYADALYYYDVTVGSLLEFVEKYL